MPKTTVKAGTWEHDLRRTVRREHGGGWTLYPQAKGTKLTRRYEDGSKQSVTLPLEWKASNQTAIANEVGVLVVRMHEGNLSLRDAYQRGKQVEAKVMASGLEAGAIDWRMVADSFLTTRDDNRNTTKRDTTSRVGKAVELLTAAKGRPSDGPSLMKAYADAHFKQCAAGGEGRKRHLGDVAAFLDHAVEKCGAPSRWKPMDGTDRELLIGTSDDADDTLTPPIKPDDFANLLDALEADGKGDLRLAVALVGCFGLRPAELAALKVDGDKLYVLSNVKRNARSKKKPVTAKRVIALELPGRTDGARALTQYSSGLVKLPLAVRNAIATGEFKKVGDAFRQLLDRYPYWASLVAANPGLTPYSLRHGWAWRAHKLYAKPISIRDAAALMRHTPNTHMKHYGQWTDEQGLEDAVASAMAATTSTPQLV